MAAVCPGIGRRVYKRWAAVPLSESTMWERCEATADAALGVFQQLMRLGADGELMHTDDTWVRILACLKEDEKEKGRATNTSGIVVKVGERKIALYFSGRHHAGENHDKRNAAYFLWEFGKPPDVVIEIVDDEKGEELDRLMCSYERIRVTYYVVYDPRQLLGDERLHIFELCGGKYRRRDDCILPEIGLRLTIWEGEHRFVRAPWLRWCDEQGNLLLTGGELYQITVEAKADAEARSTRIS